MVADKMVQTKWYGQNGIRTKCDPSWQNEFKALFKYFELCVPYYSMLNYLQN